MKGIRLGKLIIAIFSAVLLLASCKSSKVAVQNETAVRLTGEAQLEAVIANTPLFDSFSSRLRLTIPTKKGELTVNGTLKMQRDTLIQISLLIPILRSEAARVEISPSRILVIDRINKRYAAIPVSGLRDYFHTEVDFGMLQSLFCNGIFLPGKYILNRSDYSSFNVFRQAGNVELSRASKEFNYTFSASSLTNRLTRSVVETHSRKFRLQWEYADFMPVGNTVFPSLMGVSFGSIVEPVSAKMELSRLSVNDQALSATAVPSKYEQISLNELLKMIENL